MTQRHEASNYCWKNNANRLAQGRVATNLQLVRSEIAAKSNRVKGDKVRNACKIGMWIRIPRSQRLRTPVCSHIDHRRRPLASQLTVGLSWLSWWPQSEEEDSSAVCVPLRLPVPASIACLPRDPTHLFPYLPGALCAGQSCFKDGMK